MSLEGRARVKSKVTWGHNGAQTFVWSLCIIPFRVLSREYVICMLCSFIGKPYFPPESPIDSLHVDSHQKAKQIWSCIKAERYRKINYKFYCCAIYGTLKDSSDILEKKIYFSNEFHLKLWLCHALSFFYFTAIRTITCHI